MPVKSNAGNKQNTQKRLGKGLDGIIQNKTGIAAKTSGKSESAVKGSAVMIDINKIERNKEQPRKKFDESAIKELAESIKQHGVLQPIIVQDRKEYYEIIAGERRWRASKEAGLKEVPVIIKNMTEQEIVEISLIENIQREDLDPIEEALAYKRLKKEFRLTDDQVAEKVSKSRAAITNSIRLLKLSPKVQELVISGELSTGHARTLISVEGADNQLQIAKKIMDQQLSVRETEKLIKNLKNDKSKDEKSSSKSEDKKISNQYQLQYNEYAETLSKKLGMKVSVHLNSDQSGKMEINFYNVDDFEKVFELLKRK